MQAESTACMIKDAVVKRLLPASLLGVTAATVGYRLAAGTSLFKAGVAVLAGIGTYIYANCVIEDVTNGNHCPYCYREDYAWFTGGNWGCHNRPITRLRHYLLHIFYPPYHGGLPKISQ